MPLDNKSQLKQPLSIIVLIDHKLRMNTTVLPTQPIQTTDHLFIKLTELELT